MTPLDARLFLRLGALICLFGTVAALLDIALPKDMGVLDQVSDLVSGFALYLLVGLGFGVAVLRSGWPARLASWLLLVSVAGEPLVAMVEVPLGSEVLLGVFLVGVFALALALVGHGVSHGVSRLGGGLGLATLAVGAGAGVWASVVPDSIIRASALAAMTFALAVLFELARRAEPSARPASSWETWRGADRGLWVIRAGERGRLVILAVLFLGGIVARAADNSEFLAWLAIPALALVIVTVTVGLGMLRDAPEGTLWASAGFGMGLLASVSIALELLTMLLGLDGLAGLPVTSRHIGHCALAACAALAVGALGRRADDDHWTDARASAALYVGLFFLTYTALLVRDFRAPSGVILVTSLAVLGLTIGAVLRFTSLCTEVRNDLPAIAATEAFGGDAPPATGEQEAL